VPWQCRSSGDGRSWSPRTPGEMPPEARLRFGPRMLANTLTVMDSPSTWIREERTRLGLSTRDLARLAGVSYPTISRIENEREQPRWSTLQKIFDVLGHPLMPSPSPRNQPRLADMADAWTADATGTHHPDWARLRGLIDQLRLRPTLLAEAIAVEPPRSNSELLDTLLAAIAEKLADDAGVSRPQWTRTRPPLRLPWSVAARPSKQAEAEKAAPAQFVSRGLMIPASTLWRNRDLALA
jgi:transcriptional regulator with XRE-family HTH domain